MSDFQKGMWAGIAVVVFAVVMGALVMAVVTALTADPVMCISENHLCWRTR